MDKLQYMNYEICFDLETFPFGLLLVSPYIPERMMDKGPPDRGDNIIKIIIMGGREKLKSSKQKQRKLLKGQSYK